MVKKKTNDEIAVPVPDVETPPAVQVDEWHGMGGSYILDQATGKRIRIEGPAVGADSIRPETETGTGTGTGTGTATTEEEKADEIQ